MSRQYWAAAITIGISLATAGCNGIDVSSQAGSQEYDTGDFGQFKYSVSGDCSQRNIWFHLVAFQSLDLGKDPVSGNRLRAEMQFVMKDNGEGSFHYVVNELVACSGDSCQVETRQDEWLDAKWTLDRGAFRISGVGSAIYVSYNNQPALDLKIDDGSALPAVFEGKTAFGLKSSSTQGDRGQTASEYCESH